MRVGVVRLIRYLLLLVMLVGVTTAAIYAWQSVGVTDVPAWVLRGVGYPQPLRDKHIGVIAGHSGNDSGAVCDDGFTEAAANQAVADELERQLRRSGATVDVLAEFDPRLASYDADVLVSIHADSCQVDLSGFKVAGRDDGASASERLTECLWGEYGRVTGLAPHTNTVTADMLYYHAFEEIAASTPAAIIETGFLKADRRMLARQPRKLASGIKAGIECFLGATH